MTGYKTEYDGVYFDGRTPTRNKVRITVTREGLKLLNIVDSTTVFWHFSDIRQSNDVHTDTQVKIEKREEGSHEILIIDDPSFIDAIKSISPDFRSGYRPTFNRSRWIRALAYSFVGAVVAAFIIYKWLIPSFINLVAEIIPVSWEQSLGERYKAVYGASFPACEDEELIGSVDIIKNSLVNTLKDSPYKYDITLLKNGMVNAFALPGGNIFLFSGLIESTKRPEELAGVIAHEIQHIEQRHATKMILRELSFSAIIAAVTGNTEGFELAIGTARQFGALGYSRESERSADAEGVRMLISAGIDPRGMIDFFKTMEEKYGSMSGIFEYLSTHPSTDERISNLNDIIGGYKHKTDGVLNGSSWDEVKKRCGETDGD